MSKIEGRSYGRPDAHSSLRSPDEYRTRLSKVQIFWLYTLSVGLAIISVYVSMFSRKTCTIVAGECVIQPLYQEARK